MTDMKLEGQPEKEEATEIERDHMTALKGEDAHLPLTVTEVPSMWKMLTFS